MLPVLLLPPSNLQTQTPSIAAGSDLASDDGDYQGDGALMFVEDEEEEPRPAPTQTRTIGERLLDALLGARMESISNAYKNELLDGIVELFANYLVNMNIMRRESAVRALNNIVNADESALDSEEAFATIPSNTINLDLFRNRLFQEVLDLVRPTTLDQATVEFYQSIDELDDETLGNAALSNILKWLQTNFRDRDLTLDDAVELLFEREEDEEEREDEEEEQEPNLQEPNAKRQINEQGTLLRSSKNTIEAILVSKILKSKESVLIAQTVATYPSKLMIFLMQQMVMQVMIAYGFVTQREAGRPTNSFSHRNVQAMFKTEGATFFSKSAKTAQAPDYADLSNIQKLIEFVILALRELQKSDSKLMTRTLEVLRRAREGMEFTPSDYTDLVQFVTALTTIVNRMSRRYDRDRPEDRELRKNKRQREAQEGRIQPPIPYTITTLDGRNTLFYNLVVMIATTSGRTTLLPEEQALLRTQFRLFLQTLSQLTEQQADQLLDSTFVQVNASEPAISLWLFCLEAVQELLRMGRQVSVPAVIEWVQQRIEALP